MQVFVKDHLVFLLAISAYHEYFGGKAIGQHPKVYTLFFRKFNQRPPKPRLRLFMMLKLCGTIFTWRE